jgi:hypothetical protein
VLHKQLGVHRALVIEILNERGQSGADLLWRVFLQIMDPFDCDFDLIAPSAAESSGALTDDGSRRSVDK